MPINRRELVAMVAGIPALACRATWAAEANALFWRLDMPEGGRGIIFGYARVAPMVAPDVVRDGMRLVEEAKRVVIDFENVTSPALSLNDLPPLLPKLDQKLADDVRGILTAMGLSPAAVAGLPGIAVGLFLYGEGQTKPEPAVGGAIMERAKALGRPVTTLLTASDVKRLRRPLDFKELDKTVDARTIAFLIETRRRVGPIGAHCETLYRERRGEELDSFTKRLSEHGLQQSEMFFDSEAGRELMLARLPAALAPQQANDLAFCLLPIGLLTGPRSMLAVLRERGARTTALA